MSPELTIGLGTALVLIVLAALLLRGRFGRRPERPRKGDPAAFWLQGEAPDTPPARDMPSRGQGHAADEADADADGDADGGGGGGGND